MTVLFNNERAENKYFQAQSLSKIQIDRIKFLFDLEVLKPTKDVAITMYSISISL